jgi:two-component system, NtrC family, response regulator AtoC
MSRILIIDDEPGLRHTLSVILAGDGHTTVTASNGEEGLRELAGEPVDLVLCDIRMPEMDGLTFLDRRREEQGRELIIMMSAYGDDDDAIAAIQRGAYDFIPKPFRAEQVLVVVRKAIERERLRRQVEQLSDELEAVRGPGEVVGTSDALRAVTELARKVARHPSTVLITGESGTGKELIARLVHRASSRAAGPFVAVNCGAIPESLLESELFGHVKGAFTGASGDRAGLFEEAGGGTILLDEIGELPVQLQVKLLRVLQEAEIRRVGDNRARKVDVRVIAATSRDLEAMVSSGGFRSDLYYRINVVRLHLPPLRERAEDIPVLARHFVDVQARRLGMPVPQIGPNAMRRLVSYEWPGNVRELENAIERALILSDGTMIKADDLPGAVQGKVAPPLGTAGDLSVKRQTEALEKTLIRQALERTGGNRTRAAQLLDLSHRALLYKIREYGLEAEWSRGTPRSGSVV